MSRFRRLLHRTRNRMVSIIGRDNIVKRRLRELAAHSPKVDRLARRMGSYLREMKAEALIEKIEDKLKDSRDPKERMALHASIETVRFLTKKEAEIPETLEELIRLQSDLIMMMHHSCMERLKPILMSPQMMAHAARAEKEAMKN